MTILTKSWKEMTPELRGDGSRYNLVNLVKQDQKRVAAFVIPANCVLWESLQFLSARAIDVASGQAEGRSDYVVEIGEVGPLVLRHPCAQIGGHFIGVSDEHGEVVERVDPVELARVDQAHVLIADGGAVAGLIEQCVFRSRIAFFNARSQILLSSGALGERKGIKELNRAVGPACRAGPTYPDREDLPDHV